MQMVDEEVVTARQALIVSTEVTLPGLPRPTQNHWNTVTVGRDDTQLALMRIADAIDAG